MNIVFLTSAINHARYLKRIKIISSFSTVNVKTMYFERKNSYPGNEVVGESINLGSVSHKNYFRRILLFLKSISKIKSELKNTNIIYAFSFDMLFIYFLIFPQRFFLNKMRHKVVYEVGDIREIFLGRDFKAYTAKKIEKLLIKKSYLVVVTSLAYETHYFRGIQKLGKTVSFFILENKLFTGDFNDEGVLNEDPKANCNSITIGYFGALRCEKSWEILKKLSVNSNSRINIYLRGTLQPYMAKDLEDDTYKGRIIYGGSYVSPDELKSIYSKVDLVWACYPYQKNVPGNWQWARTIRFYESCFFGKPMVTQLGTEDAKVVEKYKIGKSTQIKNVDEAVKKILEITFSDILSWEENIRKLPNNIYIYTDEHERLVEILRTGNTNNAK